MRAGLALRKSADDPTVSHADAVGRSRPTLMARLRDIWAVWVRAQAAAHHYETHRPLSEQELAARGLTRGGLPRAAFRKLTGSP
jgi:hypothetical protein